MFEKVVLRHSDAGSALTIGELAEAILFYQNVHLVLDYGSLVGLVAKIGMPDLLSLLSRPNISAVYCEENPATRTESQGAISSHEFIAYMLSGNQEVGQLTSRKKRLEFILERQGYPKKQARRLVERFRRLVPIKKLSDNYFIEGGIVKAAWSDINEPEFVYEAMRRVLAREVGSEVLPTDFTFKVIANHPKFQIVTNIDFDSINSARKSRVPTLYDISPAHFINNVLEARTDIVLASHYGGDFYTSEIASQISRLKHHELLRRMGIDKEDVKEFNEIILDDTPSVKEALNSGQRTFSEFLSVLDKSQKFREWMQGVNPDEKLVKAYFKDVTSEGWVSSLPSKALRYVMCAIVTAIEPISGTLGAAADTMVTEKILGGWRPSHFVEKRLKPFLQSE